MDREEKRQRRVRICVENWLAPKKRRFHERKTAWFLLRDRLRGQARSPLDLDQVARSIGDENASLVREDLAQLLGVLRGKWVGMRSDDELLLELRRELRPLKPRDWSDIPTRWWRKPSTSSLWASEQRKRVRGKVESWFQGPRRSSRLSVWFILLAPYLGEPPSLRTDVETVAWALGEPSVDAIRADLHELLTLLSLPGSGRIPDWTKESNEHAFRALRSLLSLFEEEDWVAVPGHVPQRRHFPRHDASEQSLRIVARAPGGVVELRVVDVSESGMLIQGEGDTRIDEETVLSDMELRRGEGLLASGLRATVLRSGSPTGIVLDPEHVSTAYRTFVGTLPEKA